MRTRAGSSHDAPAGTLLAVLSVVGGYTNGDQASAMSLMASGLLDSGDVEASLTTFLIVSSGRDDRRQRRGAGV